MSCRGVVAAVWDDTRPGKEIVMVTRNSMGWYPCALHILSGEEFANERVNFAWRLDFNGNIVSTAAADGHHGPASSRNHEHGRQHQKRKTGPEISRIWDTMKHLTENLRNESKKAKAKPPDWTRQKGGNTHDVMWRSMWVSAFPA